MKNLYDIACFDDTGISDDDSLSARYSTVTKEKSGGVVYTPKLLADFVAQEMIKYTKQHLLHQLNKPIRILDPAVGHGELLLSLLECLTKQKEFCVEIYGFETDSKAIDNAKTRIRDQFPEVQLSIKHGNFLDFILENFGEGGQGNLFHKADSEAYDLVISNPPYVRTQIMGAIQSRRLAKLFGLSGRLDMYYAFILGISRVLKPNGIAGIITSNRFMTVKSGTPVRRALLERFSIRRLWDLGDTKLFKAAVLPAILIVEGEKNSSVEPPKFSSIYQTNDSATKISRDPITALSFEGIVEIADGRRFLVQHGMLNAKRGSDEVWRMTTEDVERWLASVKAHTWRTFGDIGKIRVGVKTCADTVFIRNDWLNMPINERPELLRPLITHHVAQRFKSSANKNPNFILYPHESVHGVRRPVNLENYPRCQNYLEKHRATLEGRRYINEAHRQWYEIWVPQDPSAWDQTKLVFRDIAEKPTFWIDLDGSVVNGDCYWLISKDRTRVDLLWLAAAVGNSTFIERFYDISFNNRLYSGRRRFITQYVEKFPLPDPESSIGKGIIKMAKSIYEHIPSEMAAQLQRELDGLIWDAFSSEKST